MTDEVDRVFEAAWRIDCGYPREALEVLRDASPEDPRVFVLRARALLELGRTGEAETEARRGLAIEPGNVESLEMLAAVQLNGDAWAAEQTVQKALQLSPENPRLLSLQIFILMAQDRFEAAETVLERLVHIAPEDEMTERTRMMFLMRASHSSAARDAAEVFMGRYPDEAFAHYVQGLALLSGRWWRGLRHLRQAAAMRPQDPLLVETARVMHSWYLWPVHLTSGMVHWLLVALYGVFVIRVLLTDGGDFWRILLIYGSYLGYRWGALGVARVALDRRVARALRER